LPFGGVRQKSNAAKPAPARHRWKPSHHGVCRYVGNDTTFRGNSRTISDAYMIRDTGLPA
jgi:hypothetical protein